MRHSFLLAFLTLSPLAPLAGQWTVAAELGVSRFGGSARDTATVADPPSARPSPGATLGLRLERQFGGGRIGVGLGVLRAGTGLVVEGEQTAVTAKDAATLVEITAEVSLQVAANTVGTSVRLHAGPVLAVWLPQEDEGRSRAGAHAGLSVVFPLWGRLTGSVRAVGAVTASMFEPGESPPEYERRATRRGGVSVGVRYRL